jgi:dCMP deaminase
MSLAKHIAEWSKDRSRKVGCVIIGPNREIRSTGYNGFPRGVNDDKDERHERPAKYFWTEHAERNAVYNAVRNGVSLNDSVAYCTLFPCSDCSRALIQSGIKKLFTYEPNFDDPTYGNDFKVAIQMLVEADVEVTCLSKETYD